MADPTLPDPLPLAAQLERAEELERRAWAGTDDIAYCLRWAGIHRALVAAALERSRG